MTQAPPIVVWTEVPVTDMNRAMAFYAQVFGWTMTLDTSGPNPMAVFNSSEDGTSGHLYPGKPATGNGPTIHFAVPDRLDAAAARCREAGGTVQGDPVGIPQGRFQYALDPDGNSIGLFEAAG